MGWTATALACLLVLFVLVAPNEITDLTLARFLRIPLEGLLGVIFVLLLPARPRRIVAIGGGVVLGLLAIVKIVDMGFFAVLDRPFDLVLDWSLFASAVEFLSRSMGKPAVIGIVAAAVLLAAVTLVLVTLSVLRLARLVVRHRRVARRTVAVLAITWIVCATFGVRVAQDGPVAVVLSGRVMEIRDGLRDQEAFVREAAVDAFRDVPDDELLTALHGKDVIVTFVESYGRDAVEDPEFAPSVGAVLDSGTARLDAAGFTARSAYLTSPTAGGNSWLAHATFLSGLWINNQQRYANLVNSDRLTLNSAFRRAGWRTVGVMPGITRAWPEGKFYGYDQVYDSRNLGYRGPRFNFSSIPDQYTMEAFERAERAAPDRTPVMAEIPLLSSHAPWTPLPRLVDWADVGDGAVFAPMVGGGDAADESGRESSQVRTWYRLSIEYTLSTLISYVETYGDDDLVLIYLGDHQPSPVVTGGGASRDVPITIVTRDRAVLDRISGWGWQDGLRPGPDSPVQRMDTFRDRFLTAFGP
jgi:hypothetical protein